jgi:hypothetical protein
MSPKELTETPLRVLTTWIDGRKPASADMDLLKQAFPSSAHLAVDDFACQVIHDLNGRAFIEPVQAWPRNGICQSRLRRPASTRPNAEWRRTTE